MLLTTSVKRIYKVRDTLQYRSACRDFPLNKFNMCFDSLAAGMSNNSAGTRHLGFHYSTRHRHMSILQRVADRHDMYFSQSASMLCSHSRTRVDHDRATDTTGQPTNIHNSLSHWIIELEAVMLSYIYSGAPIFNYLFSRT